MDSLLCCANSTMLACKNAETPTDLNTNLSATLTSRINCRKSKRYVQNLKRFTAKSCKMFFADLTRLFRASFVALRSIKRKQAFQDSSLTKDTILSPTLNPVSLSQTASCACLKSETCESSCIAL